MTILCLCREDNLCWEPRGYARAFRRRSIRVVCVEWGTPLNADLLSLLKLCPEAPAFILKPETDFPLLPRGLAEVLIPTVCVYNDPYAYTHRRIRWSMLFDYVVLLHPGFEDQFRKSGHPRPMTLPHAVDAQAFEGPEVERAIELSSVGRTDGPNYSTRRNILARLATQFRMNEWWRRHSYEEMAALYRATKVVVNVPRDDFPVDVSLRFAEAMAAGALFVTREPSELPAMGFEENVHFVAYHEPGEVAEIVRKYLNDEAARRRMADAGREKILREFTYDCRAAQLLEKLEEGSGRFFAPARQWSEERIRLAYIDYYTAHQCLDYAYGELRRVARRSLRTALSSVPLVAGAISRGWRTQVRAKLLQKS